MTTDVPGASPALSDRLGLVPSAWLGPTGQTMPNEIYEAWAPMYPEAAKDFRPLFDQAALAAAVSAERERCAKVCEALTPKEPNCVWEAAYKSVGEDMAAAIRKGDFL